MVQPVRPRTPGDPTRRALFVSRRLAKAIHGETAIEEWERRRGELLADLEVFVTAREIRPDYLFLLYPRSRAVWEIRSNAFDPSLRVFGFFARRDVFVATNFAARADLQGWDSPGWKQARRNAIVEWNGLFHPCQPRDDTDIHELVTGAIDGRYFRDPPALR